MNTLNLELEKKHNVECVLNKNNNFDFTIKKDEEVEISIELEKIELIDLINGILKVYSLALKGNESVLLYDIVKGKISLEYNASEDIINIRINSDMSNKLDEFRISCLKLTEKDLLSISIMLSSVIIK